VKLNDWHYVLVDHPPAGSSWENGRFKVCVMREHHEL